MADRCVYIPSYDCRCDDPLNCVIIKYPPGTFTLRKQDDDEEKVADVPEL